MDITTHKALESALDRIAKLGKSNGMTGQVTIVASVNIVDDVCEGKFQSAHPRVRNNFEVATGVNVKIICN
jgi:hypothetical protein